MSSHFVGRATLLVELVDRLVEGQSPALSAAGLALARHLRVLAPFADEHPLSRPRAPMPM